MATCECHISTKEATVGLGTDSGQYEEDGMFDCWLFHCHVVNLCKLSTHAVLCLYSSDVSCDI